MVDNKLASMGNIPVDWIPAPVSNWGGESTKRRFIVIHDIEGSAQSGLETLSNPNVGASAHFIADPLGGRFIQMVPLDGVAWTAGNWAVNQSSIQIELPGWAGRPYAPETIEYAAIFIATIARLFDIRLQRLGLDNLNRDDGTLTGVFGHMDVPNPDNPLRGGGRDGHTDPGTTFPWSEVMDKAIRIDPTYTGGGGGVVPPERGGAVPVTEENFFPETGFTMAHGFWHFWQDFGGLDIFGFPISNEFVDDNGMTVQYCERARFEWHPGSGAPHDVMLGRVGWELASCLGLLEDRPKAFSHG